MNIDKYRAQMLKGSIIEYEKFFCEEYIKLFEEYKNAIEGDEKYVNAQKRKDYLYSSVQIENEEVKRKELQIQLEAALNQLQSMIETIQNDSLHLKYFDAIKGHMDRHLIRHQSWCRSSNLIIPSIKGHLTYKQYESNYFKVTARIIAIDIALGINIYYQK